MKWKHRKIVVLTGLLVLLTSLSSLQLKPEAEAASCKALYLQKGLLLQKEVARFYALLQKGNEEQLQLQFYKMRYAYKQIEVFIEYFYPFYATKLNGPPLPFFEEAEPEKMVQSPAGMQLIESALFPHFKNSMRKQTVIAAAEMLRYTEELLQVKESVAFTNETVFDAMMEELYRISALGLAGFDAQVSFNAINECQSSLSGLQEILCLYKAPFSKQAPKQYAALAANLKAAQSYLQQHPDFTAFNRMHFITTFLNPITTGIGQYKEANDYKDNPSGLYYSAIKKKSTLFETGAFVASRFQDDYTATPQKVELGRRLFFETRLSLTNQRSCATCHKPEKAFTDGLRKSTAVDGHSPVLRNAPTLLNVALQRSLFSDSRSRTLEEQVLDVLNNANEMHGSAKETAEKIIAADDYKLLYQATYPNAKQGEAATNIGNAIACYERTLVALNSRFDQHMNGNNTLSRSEVNGFNLFMGKAKCGTCHFMPLFSGAKPPRYYYMESEVLGVPAKARAKKAKLDEDSGRYRITGSTLHLFSFKTPSLRNVALTAPYMHNGVFDTLEEVVEFYNQGGGRGLHIGPANQTLPFEQLKLTKEEKKELVAFLKSLTDTTVRQ